VLDFAETPHDPVARPDSTGAGVIERCRSERCQRPGAAIRDIGSPSSDGLYIIWRAEALATPRIPVRSMTIRPERSCRPPTRRMCCGTSRNCICRLTGPRPLYTITTREHGPARRPTNHRQRGTGTPLQQRIEVAVLPQTSAVNTSVHRRTVSKSYESFRLTVVSNKRNGVDQILSLQTDS
jgi:hypothetical protein